MLPTAVAAAPVLAAADGGQAARIYAPDPVQTPPDVEAIASGELEAGAVHVETAPAEMAMIISPATSLAFSGTALVATA